jgi:hypothetical protein
MGRIEEAKAAFGSLHAWDDASLAFPEETAEDGPEFGFDEPDAVEGAASSSSSSLAAASQAGTGSGASLIAAPQLHGVDAHGWGGEGIASQTDPVVEAAFVAAASQPKASRTARASAAAAIAAVHGAGQPTGGQGGSRKQTKKRVSAADAAELRRVKEYLKRVDDEVIPVETD